MLFAQLACALPGSSSVPSDVSEAVDPSTESVHVSFTVDDSRAVSAEIPAEGGTVTASGADGTQFTLVVPEGALIQPTTITMTPIESMEGLPTSGGLAAAVELKPDGLNFYDIVTLTIDLPQAIPLEEQVPIGVTGAEHNLEIAFADVQNGSFRLQLLHFSSAGVAKGLLADMEPVRQRLGGDVEARLRSIAAREVAYHAQRKDPFIVTPQFIDWYVRTFREYVLKPRLNAAGESCAAGRLALLTYVEFQRSLQLLGAPQAEEGFTQEILDLLPTIARRCITEEYELCRDDHIIHRIRPAIKELEHMMQILGLGGTSMAQVMSEAQDLAAKCLRFELVFESEVTEQVADAKQVSQVESTVQLKYQAGSTAITGEGPLVNVHYEAHMSLAPCTDTAEPSPDGTFIVRDLELKVVHDSPNDELGSVGDILLTYDPGATREVLTTFCPGMAPGGISLGLPVWSGLYGVVHQIELGGIGGGSYGATGWTTKGDDLFAQLNWERSNQLGTEQGSFKLYHRPE